MYATRAGPRDAPADVSALTVAARNDLYGDAFNEDVFMRPGARLTARARRDRRRRASTGRWRDWPRWSAASSDAHAAAADRVRPLLRAVDAGRRGAGGRGDPGGEGLVTRHRPWLTVLWAVPMVGAAVVILLPSAAAAIRQVRRRWRCRWRCWRSRSCLAVAFDPAGAQYQFVEDHEWIPSFGTGYILGLGRHRAGAGGADRGAGAAAARRGLERRADDRLSRPRAAHLRRADAGRRGHGADLAGRRWTCCCSTCSSRRC